MSNQREQDNKRAMEFQVGDRVRSFIGLGTVIGHSTETAHGLTTTKVYVSVTVAYDDGSQYNELATQSWAGPNLVKVSA